MPAQQSLYLKLTPEGFLQLPFNDIEAGDDILGIHSGQRYDPEVPWRGLSAVLHGNVDVLGKGAAKPGKERHVGKFMLGPDEPEPGYKNPVPQVDPGYVVRCMVIDMIKQYTIKHDGEGPNVISLTTGMETLLRYHGLCESREAIPYFGTWKHPLRPETWMGLKVHYDASDFKLVFEAPMG